MAIEDQFYPIWPVIIYYFSRRSFFQIVIMIYLLAVLLKASSLFGNLSYSFLYYNTVTRIDGLCLGAMIGYFLNYYEITPECISAVAMVGFVSLLIVIGIYIFLGGFYPKILPSLIMGVGDTCINLFYASFLFWGIIFEKKIFLNKFLIS